MKLIIWTLYICNLFLSRIFSTPRISCWAPSIFRCLLTCPVQGFSRNGSRPTFSRCWLDSDLCFILKKTAIFLICTLQPVSSITFYPAVAYVKISFSKHCFFQGSLEDSITGDRPFRIIFVTSQPCSSPPVWCPHRDWRQPHALTHQPAAGAHPGRRQVSRTTSCLCLLPTFDGNEMIWDEHISDV